MIMGSYWKAALIRVTLSCSELREINYKGAQAEAEIAGRLRP